MSLFVSKQIHNFLIKVTSIIYSANWFPLHIYQGQVLFEFRNTIIIFIFETIQPSEQSLSIINFLLSAPKFSDSWHQSLITVLSHSNIQFLSLNISTLSSTVNQIISHGNFILILGSEQITNEIDFQLRDGLWVLTRGNTIIWI